MALSHAFEIGVRHKEDNGVSIDMEGAGDRGDGAELVNIFNIGGGGSEKIGRIISPTFFRRACLSGHTSLAEILLAHDKRK